MTKKIEIPPALNVKIEDIKSNPNNPRFIRDEKFTKLVKSIEEFPQMLALRPIIVNDQMVVLGGNMRLKASQEAGLKQIPVIKANQLTPEQQREFIIKDNVGFGEWDWELIANDWDYEELEAFGLDLPGDLLNPDEFGDEFELADGDKNGLEQITYTLAEEQAIAIKNAIDDIKGTEEYKYQETFGNENGNGNALYLLVTQWAEQRK